MARQFTDDADGVELAQDTFSSSSKVSLFAWVKLDSLGALQTIWGRRSATQASLHFRVLATNRLSFSWTHSNNTFNTYNDANAPLVNVTDVWYALGVSFDYSSPTTVAYFINGSQENRARNSGSGVNPQNPAIPITLGRYDSSGAPLKGTIAFPARWSRVLSAEEHAQLAAGFHPKHIRNGLASLPDLERGIDLVTGEAFTFTDAPALTPNPRIFA